MKQITVNIRYYLPVILWALLIFLASSRQRIQVSKKYWINFAFFKTLHIIEYAIFFILVYRSILNTTKKNKINIAISTFVITVIYAISDEIHQSFVPTRDAKLRDVGFDTIGAMFAWYFLWKLLPILPPKLKKWAGDWQLY